MDIGNRLRALLKQRGLKQKWVAEQAGIPEASFQRILCGRQDPSAENLAGLSTTLGVTTDWLLGLSNKAS